MDVRVKRRKSISIFPIRHLTQKAKNPQASSLGYSWGELEKEKNKLNSLRILWKNLFNGLLIS